MKVKVSDYYTSNEFDELYDIVYQLPSVFFGNVRIDDFERMALRLAEIVKARQERQAPKLTIENP